MACDCSKEQLVMRGMTFKLVELCSALALMADAP
jgi:hypothetical protein